MRRWLALAARAFAAFGVVLWLVFWSLLGGAVRTLVLGLALGAVAAVLVCVIAAVRGGSRATPVSAEQRTALLLPLSVEQAHHRAVAALAAVGAQMVDDVPGTLRARTRVSLWSWGEMLTVVVRAGTDGCEVLVDSRPRWRTSLGDYGQARRVVQRVAELIAVPADAR